MGGDITSNERLKEAYCNTLFFRRILILRFPYVENLLHFNFVDFPVYFIKQFVSYLLPQTNVIIEIKSPIIVYNNTCLLYTSPSPRD